MSYHREAVTSHLASPWRFRDGNEYLVSLSISDKPKWASISLQDKITAEEWSGQFDLKYIENLTQRTGNYKSFDTFVAMIKSAILKKSDSVTLDLMSYEDLLTLKSNKSRVGPTASTDLNIGPNLTKFENVSDPEIYQQRQGSGFPGSNKQSNKYLIVTYVAEFDKVHYPLPLKYTGYPDATIMQQTIQKLKSEVSQLKQTNTDLIVQLQSALKTHSRYNSPKVKTVDSTEMDTADDDNDDDDDEMMTIKGNNRRPGRNVTKSVLSQEKFQSLAGMVKNLELRIENERVDHKDHVNKLEAENDYLRNRLKAIEMSENALKDKVTRLESVLAMNVGLKRNSNHNNNNHFKAHQLPVRDGISSKEVTPKESYFLGRTSSLTRTGRPKARGRPPFHPPARNVSNSSKCSSIGSERDPTAGIPINIELTNNNARHGGSNSRQSSCERRLFNPTEYVKKKKIKQERMAQMRMAKVESRIRSNSQDRGHRQQSSGSIKRQEAGKTDSATNLKEIKELRGAPVVRRNSSLESCTSERGNSKSISYLHGRRASPSPSRRTSLTNIAFPEKRSTTVKSNIGPYSSFDMIRNNKKDGRPKKGAYEESRDRFRNAYRTETNDKPMKAADSNMSFEKLQKRLHTIHAFLEVNKRRRN